MFNFSTDTILNSVVQYNPTTGEGNVYYPEGKNTLIVKNVGTFKKEDIVGIETYAAVSESKEKKTIAVPTTVVADKVYRLCIDLGLNKSTSSLYAVYAKDKIKPIYAEAISTGTTGATLATALVNNIKAYMNLVYDTALISVSVSGNNITVECTDGCQVIKSLKIERWDGDSSDNITYAGGEWVDLKATVTSNVKGEPGFGTYKYLLRNHRLPTYENVSFGNPNSAEAPILDKEYTQFVIKQRSVRSPYGVGAVGQELVSVTEHVFWVLSSEVTKFTTALAAITPTATTTVLDD